MYAFIISLAHKLHISFILVIVMKAHFEPLERSIHTYERLMHHRKN
jgi:hypothetical protein